jgi:beta-ureidopropionase / N-carbamoyl-L-amino-acid hydrolase
VSAFQGTTAPARPGGSGGLERGAGAGAGVGPALGRADAGGVSAAGVSAAGHGTPASVVGLLAQLASVGVDPRRGGYTRAGFSREERTLHEWFVQEATARGLDVERDRNGVLWAWWDVPGGSRSNAVAAGSHLDSVPGGGQYDGPLGVASALAAVDWLRVRGLRPARPLAIVVFPEEEGSRFGVACLGSRLLTGRLEPATAAGLRDASGVTLAEALAESGLDPRHLGRDQAALERIGCFVELHVEQGRGLIDRGAAVGLGSSILGHGRWKLRFSGQGNHAGTTLMDDRRDPLVAAAGAVLAVRDAARAVPEARATVGRLQPLPGGTNVIASAVELWIDARHPDDEVTAALLESIHGAAAAAAEAEGCSVELTTESVSPTVDFDHALTTRLGSALGGAPVLATGAGHDAGVLAAEIPTAMLFVRNPTGISHSPEEYAADEDAEAGALALADALQELLLAP